LKVRRDELLGGVGSKAEKLYEVINDAEEKIVELKSKNISLKKNK